MIQQGAAGDIRLSTDDGATELPLVPGPLSVPLGGGPTAGCLVFDVQVPIGPDGPGHLEALDVGCRFFFDDPELARVGGPGVGAFPGARPRAPRRGPGRRRDPRPRVRPRPASRPSTRTGRSWRSPAPAALRSHYRTNLGSVVDVAPRRRPAAVRHPADAPGAVGRRTRSTCVPHGTFTPPPAGPRARTGAHVRPRGGGVHRARASTQLRFVAGGPAYAPDFDPAATTGLADSGAPATRPGLDGLGRAHRAGPARLLRASRRAPRCSVSGHARTRGGRRADGPLPFFEIPAATLPRATIPPPGRRTRSCRWPG